MNSTSKRLANIIVEQNIKSLTPYAGNARTHSDKQIDQIADSIQRFGFANPVLVDEAGNVIAGHGRIAAARKLGFDTVPTACLSGLSEADRKAYIIADMLHKPRLLSDNGSSYVAGELADYLADKNIKHVRGAPFHPQTQGKIERWHQTLKNRMLLENYYLPGDLETQVEAFVEH